MKIVQNKTYEQYDKKYGRKFKDGKLEFFPYEQKDQLKSNKKYWEITESPKGHGFYEVPNLKLFFIFFWGWAKANKSVSIPVAVALTATVAAGIAVPLAINSDGQKADLGYSEMVFHNDPTWTQIGTEDIHTLEVFYCGSGQIQWDISDSSTIEELPYASLDEDYGMFTTSVTHTYPSNEDKLYTIRIYGDVNFGIGNGAPLYSDNSGCIRITEVTLSNKLTDIKPASFFFCMSELSQLKTINLPSTITKIGDSSFSGCSMETINLPQNVTELGVESFKDCKTLTGINLNNNIKEIPDSCFQNCGFKNIALPSQLENIACYAFSGCANLKSITIPETVTNIGYMAFSKCNSINSIFIPKNVATLKDNNNNNYTNPFYINKLTEIKVDPENQYLTSKIGTEEQNAILSKDGSILYVGCPTTTCKPFNSAITTIKNDSIIISEEDLRLTEMTFGSNITSIEAGAIRVGSLSRINFEQGNCNLGEFAIGVSPELGNCSLSIINLYNIDYMAGIPTLSYSTFGQGISFNGATIYFNDSNDITEQNLKSQKNWKSYPSYPEPPTFSATNPDA